MSGSFQRQVEVRILHHLHCRLHFGSGPESADGMFDWICKNTNISRARFDDAFASLARLGYFIESANGDEKKWRLSPFGVDWVEDYYFFTQRETAKKTLNYTARFAGTIMLGTRRRKYLDQLAAEETGNKVAVDIESSARWTRSSAIAAWLALPIAVIAILVTVIVAS